MSAISISLTLPSTSFFLNFSFPNRLQNVSVGTHSTIGQSFQIHAPLVSHMRGAIMAMTSANPDEPATGGEDGYSTDEEEIIGIQNLPLESKLQLKLEQKMKMKIDKKVRLRRKRLIRKRMMRKKGRWPPSKMKKLTNV